MGMPVPAFARPPALNPMPALPVPKKSERANARNARAKIPVPGQPAGTNGHQILSHKSLKKYNISSFHVQVGIILVQKFILEHDFSKSVTHVCFLTKVVHTFCHFCPLKQFLAMPV